jgi:hypothetical protein
MEYEFDSQEALQRLIESYRAMSDPELLELAAKPDDLTDFAADVLQGELRSRRLEPRQPVVSAPIPRVTPAPIAKQLSPSKIEHGHGEVNLITFHDAIDAGFACESLEKANVEFEVRDVSQPRVGIYPFSQPAPVALQLFVDKADEEGAKAILRVKMGLFPLQEVAVADAPVDDGTVATLGDFGRRADAEEVARVLDDAHVWHRIVANPDGTVEKEDCYTLEVKEIDVMRAGELVEKVLNLPEE